MSKNKFHIVVVDRKKLVKDFLDFPAKLYRNDKNWIRPLDDEIEKVFDPSKNRLFRTGEAIRWLLYDSYGEVVGRIAAFYDKRSAAKNEQPTGGVGFFDCINNNEAAHVLFDTGKEWLKERGMEAMDGPVNFGSRDNFWGCLYDGFHEPVFNMPYNFPYYNDLFESYGFKRYFMQYTYHVDIKPAKAAIVHEKAKRLLRDKNYHFETFDRKNEDKHTEDFMYIYNKAWARFSGVNRLRKEQAKALMNSIKPIMDERTIIFGYYKNEPIAFYIMVPDINQIVRNFNGKLGLINKLWLMYRLKVSRTCTRLIGLIFGVIPEFQGRGVESAIVARFENEFAQNGFPYTDLEMNWIGDFNPKMMKFVEKEIGGKIHKTHITYRYLFDHTRTFKRVPIV